MTGIDIAPLAEVDESRSIESSRACPMQSTRAEMAAKPGAKARFETGQQLGQEHILVRASGLRR